MVERLNPGDRHPTLRAVGRLASLLFPAFLRMGLHLPRGCAVSSLEGGIRVEWRRREREVRLVIEDDAGVYLYHENGDDYDIEWTPNTSCVARRLRWLERG